MTTHQKSGSGDLWACDSCGGVRRDEELARFCCAGGDRGGAYPHTCQSRCRCGAALAPARTPDDLYDVLRAAIWDFVKTVDIEQNPDHVDALALRLTAVVPRA